MGPVGAQEMVVIFILALVLFGPKKLPEIGRTIAKAINEFKKASNELKETWQREVDALDRETRDVREDLNKEVAKLSDATSSYQEGYYGQDSSYDYGSYGYPDYTPDSHGAVTASNSTETPIEGVSADASGAVPAEGHLIEGAHEASDAMPVVAAAAGTVATDFHSAPAVPAHDAAAEHPHPAEHPPERPAQA